MEVCACSTCDSSHLLRTVLKITECKRLIYHSGGAFPFTVGRIEHGFNVRPDLCAVDNDINPRNYLGKFWTDSLVHDAQALDLLVKVIGEVMSKAVNSIHSTEAAIAHRTINITCLQYRLVDACSSYWYLGTDQTSRDQS